VSDVPAREGPRRLPVEVVAPESLEALRQAVRRATRAGRRVRAVGADQSTAPLTETDGTAVSMRRLNRILGCEVAPDGETAVVEVECGATIEELDRYAAGRRPSPDHPGFTLVSPTLYPKPTVGGVVATGSHGTGFEVGCFSDRLVEMKIVRADGSLTALRKGDEDFPAAQVALGSLGIVYSVKLEVVRQFRVYVDKRYLPARYVLEELEDLQRSCEFLEIFWFPLQDKMWLYLMDPTRSLPDPETRWTRLRTRFDTALEQAAAGCAIPWLARRAPRATPWLNRVASRFTNTVEPSVQTASRAFHFQQVYPPVHDLSYAVPAARAREAWERAISLVDEFARASLYPVNLALHCRFTGPSGAWLAPNHGRTTCWIEVVTVRATPDWEHFFREMEDRWLALDGARPHWAKRYFRTDAQAARYPRLEDFRAARQRWDPDRVFLNRFLEPTLAGPPPAPRVPSPHPPLPPP